jgi:hypothetical protein
MTDYYIMYMPHPSSILILFFGLYNFQKFIKQDVDATSNNKGTFYMAIFMVLCSIIFYFVHKIYIAHIFSDKYVYPIVFSYLILCFILLFELKIKINLIIKWIIGNKYSLFFLNKILMLVCFICYLFLMI